MSYAIKTRKLGITKAKGWANPPPLNHQGGEEYMLLLPPLCALKEDIFVVLDFHMIYYVVKCMNSVCKTVIKGLVVN